MIPWRFRDPVRGLGEVDIVSVRLVIGDLLKVGIVKTHFHLINQVLRNGPMAIKRGILVGERGEGQPDIGPGDKLIDLLWKGWNPGDDIDSLRGHGVLEFAALSES